jgi:hypothetical protein
MGAKELTLGSDAHFALRAGVDQLAEAVMVPLGPRVRENVVPSPSSLSTQIRPPICSTASMIGTLRAGAVSGGAARW